MWLHRDFFRFLFRFFLISKLALLQCTFCYLYKTMNPFMRPRKCKQNILFEQIEFLDIWCAYVDLDLVFCVALVIHVRHDFDAPCLFRMKNVNHVLQDSIHYYCCKFCEQFPFFLNSKWFNRPISILSQTRADKQTTPFPLSRQRISFLFHFIFFSFCW